MDLRHKGWYTPGIVTGWAMGIAPIWYIAVLAQSVAITGIDVLVGIVMTTAVPACLQILVQKSAGYSVPQMMAHMRQRVLHR